MAKAKSKAKAKASPGGKDSVTEEKDPTQPAGATAKGTTGGKSAAAAKSKAAQAQYDAVDATLKALAKPPEVDRDAVIAALPSDEEMLASEGNREFQRRTGSLPEEDKIRETAWVTKAQMGAEQDPEVAERVQKDVDRLRNSTKRPHDNVKIDLPYGWQITHVVEASSRSYGPDVVRTTPGEYVAHKRVGTALIEQTGESEEQLLERIEAWERTQVSGVAAP